MSKKYTALEESNFKNQICALEVAIRKLHFVALNNGPFIHDQENKPIN